MISLQKFCITQWIPCWTAFKKSLLGVKTQHPEFFCNSMASCEKLFCPNSSDAMFVIWKQHDLVSKELIMCSCWWFDFECFFSLVQSLWHWGPCIHWSSCCGAPAQTHEQTQQCLHMPKWIADSIGPWIQTKTSSMSQFSNCFRIWHWQLH